MRRPPRVLTIAGSDSGGGAGVQADLKTFAAHSVYGMSALTAVTAQNTTTVAAVHEVPAEIVTAQIEAVFDDIGVDAVKVGMLGGSEIVKAVSRALDRYAGPPVVVDPVMVSKSGALLLAPDAVTALCNDLLSQATLVTPNLPEAKILLAACCGSEEAESDDQLALWLFDQLAEHTEKRAPMSTAAAVLLKGGHAEGAEVIDRLVVAHDELIHIVHPRIDTSSTHGTGCTLSAAIAARLGRGDALVDAVRGATKYLQGALRSAFPLGKGHGPVDHLYLLESPK